MRPTEGEFSNNNHKTKNLAVKMEVAHELIAVDCFESAVKYSIVTLLDSKVHSN